MLPTKQSTKIEKETYDNNLLFYTILKTLVQCKHIRLAVKGLEEA